MLAAYANISAGFLTSILLIDDRISPCRHSLTQVRAFVRSFLQGSFRSSLNRLVVRPGGSPGPLASTVVPASCGRLLREILGQAQSWNRGRSAANLFMTSEAACLS